MIKNDFPIQVFHPMIEKTIKNINKEYESNINAIASQMLVTMAYPLNNLYEVYQKLDTVIRPNLWLMHVAPSGSGKSPLLKMITKQIKAKESEVQISYQKKLAEYDLTGEAPKNLSLYLSKATPEGMATTLVDNNGKAVIIINSEISGIFKSFDQYSKGSGEEDFLSMYDSEYKIEKRAKSSNNIYINDINVSVLGCTQPNTIYNFLTSQRIANGMVFRFLYVVEETIDLYKNPFNTANYTTVDNMADFNQMIGYFLQGVEDLELNRKELILSNECRLYLEKWYDDFIRKDHGIDPYLLNSLMGKMYGYVLKFSIVLNRTRTYCEDVEIDKYIKIKSCDLNISIEDIQNAAKLAEYFICNSIDILNKVSDPTNKNFKENEKEMFELVPDQFTYKEFKDIYVSKGKMSESSAKRRLIDFQKNKLISRNRQGEYYKNIA